MHHSIIRKSSNQIRSLSILVFHKMKLLSTYMVSIDLVGLSIALPRLAELGASGLSGHVHSGVAYFRALKGLMMAVFFCESSPSPGVNELSLTRVPKGNE